MPDTLDPETELRTLLEEAMWDGDTDKCDEIAPCQCCCHEHTFTTCSARLWGGCRGQGSTDIDAQSWADYYLKTQGMTEEQFFTPFEPS